MGRLSEVAVAAGVVVMVVRTPGEACTNAVYSSYDTVTAVRSAEETLDDGDPHAALEAIPDIERILGREVDVPGLENRIARVQGLATIRVAVAGPGGRSQTDDVLCAVKALQRLADEHPNDPARETDLAEALASTRARSAEAKQMLEGLAERDVLTTPYGYAALARLRALDGDRQGTTAALERCQLMAKSPSICELRPTPRWMRRAGRVGCVAMVAVVAVVLGALAGALRRRARRRQMSAQ